MATLTGEVTLPYSFETHGKSSCLVIKISDVSFMDVRLIELASKVVELSVIKINSPIKYKLEFRTPLANDLKRSYAVSAVMNKGWCSGQKSQDWLRKGDFLSPPYQVKLSQTTKLYRRNIKLSCYGKFNIIINIILISFLFKQ